MIDSLQRLIQMDVDSAKGLRKVSRRTTQQELLETIGDERQRLAEELSMYVAYDSGDSIRENSAVATLQRYWRRCLKKLSQEASWDAIFLDIERGERCIHRSYEEALIEVQQSAVEELIHDQMQRLREQRCQLREVRESLLYLSKTNRARRSPKEEAV